MKVFELMIVLYLGPADDEDIVANITELSQVFKLMTILFKTKLITKTDRIAGFTNRFDYFICCSPDFRFCAIKLNGPIKCNNYDYYTPQNTNVTVEHHVNALMVYSLVWIISVVWNLIILLEIILLIKVYMHF